MVRLHTKASGEVHPPKLQYPANRERPNRWHTAAFYPCRPISLPSKIDPNFAGKEQRSDFTSEVISPEPDSVN